MGCSMHPPSDGCCPHRVWRQCSHSPWQETIIQGIDDGELCEVVRPITDKHVAACLAVMDGVLKPSRPQWTYWLNKAVGVTGAQHRNWLVVNVHSYFAIALNEVLPTSAQTKQLICRPGRCSCFMHYILLDQTMLCLRPISIACQTSEYQGLMRQSLQRRCACPCKMRECTPNMRS